VAPFSAILSTPVLYSIASRPLLSANKTECEKKQKKDRSHKGLNNFLIVPHARQTGVQKTKDNT
jgi:hypothetical protein